MGLETALASFGLSAPSVQTDAPHADYSEAELTTLNAELAEAVARGDLAEAQRIARLIRGGKVVKMKLKRASASMRAAWRKANKARKGWMKQYRKRAKKLLRKHRAKLARFHKSTESVAIRFDRAVFEHKTAKAQTTEALLAEATEIAAITKAPALGTLLPGLANLALNFNAMSERFGLLAGGLADEDEVSEEAADEIEDLALFAERLGTLAKQTAGLVEGLRGMGGAITNTPLVEALFRRLFEHHVQALEVYALLTDDAGDEAGDADEDGDEDPSNG